ncbi:MAG: hypothetical protein ICV60_08050 [Pyrinomonadaceae bacterium]|nr:hypothetical protein [Pyrinomonadaceae bacterium]
MALKDRLTSISDNLIAALLYAGGAAVIASLSAGSAYSQGLPLYLILFWALVTGSLFAFAANYISIILIRHAKDRREAKDKWLHDLAAKHREEIGRYVPILGIEVSLYGNSPTPYAKFVIWYYNASVYTISIDPTPKGSISYGKRRLTQPIELITQYRLDNLKHSFSNFLEFYQWLTKEELDFIVNDPNKHDNYFDLSQLIFTIVGSKPEMGVVPQPLHYDLKHKVKLPR